MIHKLSLATIFTAASLSFLTSASFAENAKAPRLDATWFYDGGKPVADKSLPTMTLENGKLSGTDSCNNLLGSYTLKGKRGIRFMAASTMMACPDMALANAFHNGLNQARLYEVQGDNLILRNAAGKRTLVLKRINK